MPLLLRDRVGILLCVGVVSLTPAVACQAPLTAIELKGIFDSAASVSRRIDSLNVLYGGEQRRATVLIADFGKHNAETCEYLQGHPEMCDSYDRERQDLNARSQEIQTAMKAIDMPRRELRSRFESLMTRLRTAEYPGALAGQQSQLIACSNANGVAESAACLARIQRRQPRGPQE